MHSESVTFESSHGLLHGDIVYAANETISNVFCIHGGGVRGKKSFEAMRTYLALHNITSYAFDFTGHGETGGSLSQSTLEKRVKQITEIVNHFKKEGELVTLLASSMGGYIAIKALESCVVSNLILIAPAVYSIKAYNAPFGSDFSLIIRSYESWRETDAWEILARFEGNFILLQAEKDQIIPNQVSEDLYQSASNTFYKKRIIFNNATHPLTDWFYQHGSDFDVAMSEIVNCIQKR